MMVALMQHQAGGDKPTPLLSRRKPLLEKVSANTSPEVSAALTPSQIEAVKAAIKAQEKVVSQEGVNLPSDTFTKAGSISDALEMIDAKPKRVSSKKQPRVELRATGKVRSTDKPDVKKVQKVVDSPHPRQPKAKVKASTKPTVQERIDPTIPVSWKQRVSRKEVKDVKVDRTVAYEQWFNNNPPEGLGYTEIKPKHSERYEYRAVMQKATVRIGNLDVNLGYYERVWVRVPVGVSETQRERGVMNRYRTKMSRTNYPSEVKTQVLSLMMGKLSKQTGAQGKQVPWETVDTVTEEVKDLRILQCDHKILMWKHARLASQRSSNEPLVSLEVREAFRKTLACRKANHKTYDAFEAGDYEARLKTNLLRNATQAYLKDLHNGKPQNLFHSAEQVLEAANDVDNPSLSTVELVRAESSANHVDYGEQAKRLEAFEEVAGLGKKLDAEEVRQAVFQASYYRPDLSTKKQRSHKEFEAKKKYEDEMTKEWVGIEIANRKMLQEEEDTQSVRNAIGRMDEVRSHHEELDLMIQDQYRLDAWLQKHEVFNRRDNEEYDRWLMSRASGQLFGERMMLTPDDYRYSAWLYDNAGDDFKYQQWLFYNHTPRSDNVIDMMEWRHRKAKGTDNKASVKIGGSAPLKLTLPIKPSDICVYDSIIREHVSANDLKRDKQVTSFGKVVRDVKEILGKFNKDKKSGLFLPDYLIE